MVNKIIKGITNRLSRAYYKLRLLKMSVVEWLSPPTHAGHPIPPPGLRGRTTLFWITVREHIQEGQKTADVVKQSVKYLDTNSDGIKGVLDFGCGCGRILRHLACVWPKARLVGIDVDSSLIEWNQKNLNKLAEWGKNPHDPPTSFADGEFSLIYAFSVFTHLDAKAQLQWIREFHRILEPGGIVLISVVMISEELLADFEWDHSDKTKGIALTYRDGEVARRSWVAEETEHPAYIDVKQTERYCRNEWSDYFDIVDICPNINNGQTMVVLRK